MNYNNNDKRPKQNNNNNNSHVNMNNKNNNNVVNMKRSQSSNSSYMDSPHSPLRFHSPLNSLTSLTSDFGDPEDSSPNKFPPVDKNSKAIISVPCFPPPDTLPPARHPAPEVIMNREVREEPATGVMKVRPAGGGREERRRTVAEVMGREGQEKRVAVSGLTFRIIEVALCLVSFSVMAADKTQGWSGDSFDRYKEYRYCISMNVIGFVYAAFQACDLSFYIIYGKHVIGHYLRRHFDFFMDQIIAYLLISASSSAATRVDDWQSNWGKDEFTIMASASIAMSFLAFAAFAFSALISGYNLCNLGATL